MRLRKQEEGPFRGLRESLHPERNHSPDSTRLQCFSVTDVMSGQEVRHQKSEAMSGPNAEGVLRAGPISHCPGSKPHTFLLERPTFHFFHPPRDSNIQTMFQLRGPGASRHLPEKSLHGQVLVVPGSSRALPRAPPGAGRSQGRTQQGGEAEQGQLTRRASGQALLMSLYSIV